MELDSIKTVYFIGIGGIGMSALAKYFKIHGCDVSGYDRSKTELTESLKKMGIEVHYEEDISKIPSPTDLVIYTPAIPFDNIELLYSFARNYLVKKRSEILGDISKNMFSIAIAGTHGKTTITSLISHIFNYSGRDINAFIGGIVKNYNSNLLVSEKANIIIAEADEFDRSYLHLNPDIAIVTSIDADHLDVYKDEDDLKNTFFSFMKKIKSNGFLISKKEIATPEIQNISKYQYSLDEPTDFYAKDIKIIDTKWCFTANLLGNEVFICLQISGRYNIENAIAAASACFVKGISLEQIKAGLETFQGVTRRFDYRVRTKDLVYIDDYAHHPEELKAFIACVRELYPDKRILGIFQPHLFSRTLHFAKEFANVLDSLDEVILLEIYPAREKPLTGVNSLMLLNKLKTSNKIILNKNEVLDYLKDRKLEILLTMGAGDIDQLVQPIENMLKQDYDIK